MKKHALIIGVNSYDDPEIGNLDFASRDAEAVADILSGQCKFDNISLLGPTGSKLPSNGNIVDALRTMSFEVSKEDLFLFYFSGHGLHTDGHSYFLTSNSRIHMPELASLQLGVLQKCLSRIECKERVLILDSCRNDPHKGKGEEDNIFTNDFSRDIVAAAKGKKEKNIIPTCILFSCSTGQRAYEWPEKKHGAFTYYLLEGMKKAIDSDGFLSMQQLGEYVENKVTEWSRKMHTTKPQIPWSEQIGSIRKIVLGKVELTSGIEKYIEKVETPEKKEKKRNSLLNKSEIFDFILMIFGTLIVGVLYWIIIPTDVLQKSTNKLFQFCFAFSIILYFRGYLILSKKLSIFKIFLYSIGTLLASFLIYFIGGIAIYFGAKIGQQHDFAVVTYNNSYLIFGIIALIDMLFYFYFYYPGWKKL